MRLLVKYIPVFHTWCMYMVTSIFNGGDHTKAEMVWEDGKPFLN